MKRTRRQPTLAELEQSLAFKIVVTRRGCEIHDDPLDCELPIQAAHIIPKATLRRHGFYDQVWDPRNGIGACYRAHRRSDAALARFPVDKLTPVFWTFADEVGLRYLAEKLYGEQVAA